MPNRMIGRAGPAAVRPGQQTSAAADIPAGIPRKTQRELVGLADTMRSDVTRTSDPHLRAQLEISA